MSNSNNNTRKKPLGERLGNIANRYSKGATRKRANEELARQLASLPMRNEPTYWESSSTIKNMNTNNKKGCNQKNAPKPKFNTKGKPTNLYKAWKVKCGLSGGKRRTLKQKNRYTRRAS